jgi:hypothetical protein
MNLKHHQFLNTCEEILVKPDFNTQYYKTKNTVSVSEISETLGIARGTVYLAYKKNHIPHLHVSSRFIVTRDLWNDYLNGKLPTKKCVQCEQRYKK